jgi:arginyl-tRNA synthetase
VEARKRHTAQKGWVRFTCLALILRIPHLQIAPDGTSIYLTRNVGGTIEGYEQHKFNKMIYVISSQQDLNTAQFIKMLQLMEFPWASSIEHVNYRFVLGMSTRKGTVVFLDQIIREAASVMHEQMKKNQEKYVAVEDIERTSLEVGLTAIKIQDMATERCATCLTGSSTSAR